MQVYILTGSKDKKKDYIQMFCKKHAIKGIYRHEFLEFKISDARSIKQLLSKKLHNNEHRLITIEQPTNEAQNAILKLIEELSESSFIFFLVGKKEELLSTIVSRSLVLNLGEDFKNLVKESLMQDLKSVLKDKQKLFSFCNTYITEKSSIDEIVLCLRSILVSNPTDTAVYVLLKKITEISSFVKQNNVQPKFSLEAALLNVDLF